MLPSPGTQYKFKKYYKNKNEMKHDHILSLLLNLYTILIILI